MYVENFASVPCPKPGLTISKPGFVHQISPLQVESMSTFGGELGLFSARGPSFLKDNSLIFRWVILKMMVR